jgi:hypothetical protein
MMAITPLSKNGDGQEAQQNANFEVVIVLNEVKFPFTKWI